MNTVIKCGAYYLAPPTREDIYIAKKIDIPYLWQRKGINKIMTVLIKHKCWQEYKHIFKLDEYIAPPKINTFYNKTIMDACYNGTITDYSDC